MSKQQPGRVSCSAKLTDEERRERKAATDKAWRERNHDRYIAANKRWKQQNPEKVRAQKARAYNTRITGDRIIYMAASLELAKQVLAAAFEKMEEEQRKEKSS